MVERSSLGETIRSLRRQHGLTQEQLAEGLCSPITISRIENERQMPSKTLLDALLARLHSNTYQLCNVYYQSEQDYAFVDKAKQASVLLHRGRFDELRALLERLDVSSQNRPTLRQIYLSLDAAALLSENCGPNDAEMALTKLDQAVRLTQPNLDFGDLKHVLLSRDEMQSLALRIPALFYAGQALEAIMFGKELLAALDAQEADSMEFHETRVNVEFNLSQCLELQGYFGEAFALVQRSKRECLEEHLHYYLPQLIYSEARTSFRKGDVDGARKMLDIIIPYLDLIGDAENAAVIRGWTQRELGVEL